MIHSPSRTRKISRHLTNVDAVVGSLSMAYDSSSSSSKASMAPPAKRDTAPCSSLASPDRLVCSRARAARFTDRRPDLSQGMRPRWVCSVGMFQCVSRVSGETSVSGKIHHRIAGRFRTAGAHAGCQRSSFPRSAPACAGATAATYDDSLG